MALKNRDGTPYKLRGPNPLMKEQKTWEADGFQVHNMKFKGEVAVDDRQVEALSSDFNVRDKDFAQELEDSKPPINVVEPKPEPKPEVKPAPKPEPVKFEPPPEQPRKKSTIPGKSKTFMYCLPATMRDRRDGMYGQKYQTIQYGKPFSFEGVLVEEEDMFVKVWTSVTQVTPGSVLYPKKNGEGAVDAQRWWRVQEITPKNEGFVLTGYPSDYTPSFSDVD